MPSTLNTCKVTCSWERSPSGRGGWINLTFSNYYGLLNTYHVIDDEIMPVLRRPKTHATFKLGCM